MGGQLDKKKQRLLSKPKDYTYTEANSLLTALGFVEYTKGKTSGSRRKFVREADGATVLLHKPHPGDVMPVAATKSLCEDLKEYGDIK